MATLDTAGRSVVVAGVTVIVSLLGLFAMGLSYMRGAALVAIVGGPGRARRQHDAVPGAAGLSGPPRRPAAAAAASPPRSRVSSADGHVEPGRAGCGGAGSSSGTGSSPAAVGLAAMLALAVPFLSVQFGFPDAGNNRAEATTRQAYDAIADGFGVGANGPAAAGRPNSRRRRPGPGPAARRGRRHPRRRVRLARRCSTRPATPPSSPSSRPPARRTQATQDLVHRLRDTTVPAAVAGTGTHGPGRWRDRATSIDSTADLAGRIPYLIVGVVAAVDAVAARRVPQHRRGGQGRRDEPAVGRRLVRGGRPGPAGRLGRAADRHRHTDPVAAVRHRPHVRRPLRTVHGLRGLPAQPDPRVVACAPATTPAP